MAGGLETWIVWIKRNGTPSESVSLKSEEKLPGKKKGTENIVHF